MNWILAVLSTIVLVVGTVVAASELGGEVVTLTTRDAEGVAHETPLWVVEDEGRLWLRAGDAESGWAERLRRDPAVELERDGERTPYTAVAVPDRRDRINALMQEQYGWADRLIGLMRSADRTVAIRLDPRPR